MKMVKNHMKRINAPSGWNILRKKHAFITRPNAGRDMSLCISLNTVLKEMLNKTRTTKESKHLLKRQGVFVNGMKRYDEKFPVGFLDVISFPDVKENYRLLVNQKNKIFLMKINEEEAKIKLSKVTDKKILSNDLVQINCSDGRNLILKKDDPNLKQISTNDSLLYSIPEQKIKQVIKLEKGALVFLYKGKHTGLLVFVDAFDQNNIVFKEDDHVFETKKAYAFVVGKDKPVLSVVDSASLPKMPVKGKQTQVNQNQKTKQK
jgi:small subunit ribosomal protein S4e